VTDPNNPSPAPAGVPQCYRHSGKETWIRCQRCERPICPDCMREASVGFQCPDCVTRGAKETRSGVGPYGGRRSGDPRRSTIALIATNIAVFVAVLAGGGYSSWLASRLMLTPLGRCVADDGSGWFPQAGADICERIGGATFKAGLADGAFWQALTHGFVHVDVIHIAFNVLALWVLGPSLEQVFGRARFLAIYFAATLAAGATIMWFSDPYTSTLGASGGVFGLLGAMLVLVWKVGGDLRSLGGLLAVNVAITIFVPNISWQGHLGGFVGGALVALVMVMAPQGAKRSLLQWSAVALLTVVLVVLIVGRAVGLTNV
jgi:membrane associated rhomboid family serine protease